MEQPVAQGITPRIVVLMGVTASGKTMVAEGLHNLLGWPFQEGDDLHPKSNIEKMAAGIPLTDEDRLPWLQACRAWIDARAREGRGGIMSCSALKRSYRQLLAADGVDVTFLLLNVPRDVLEQRLKGRKGHFMPASLLDSQLATLEPPGPDEHVLILNALSSPARTIARALELLRVDQA